MVYVAVLCIGEHPRELLLPSDSAAAQRIQNTKNAKLREERICAYRLLETAYYDVFSHPMPKLSFNSEGKPQLGCDKTKISVSHTDGVCVAAFSSSDVGVDVQSYGEMLGKEGVLQRFVNNDLQKSFKKQKSLEIKYLFYKIKDSKTELVKSDEDGVFSDDFSEVEGALQAAAWSRLEAVLKCRMGFCDYKNAAAFSRAARAQTRFLPTAALSVAVIEEVHK